MTTTLQKNLSKPKNNNFSKLLQKLHKVYTTITIPVLVPAGYNSNKIIIRYRKKNKLIFKSKRDIHINFNKITRIHPY